MCLHEFTLMVVHVAAVLSELSELPAAVFTLPFQVLLHSTLLSMGGLLHMPSEQSLLKELLPTDITPNQEQRLIESQYRNQDTKDLRLGLRLTMESVVSEAFPLLYTNFETSKKKISPHKF